MESLGPRVSMIRDLTRTLDVRRVSMIGDYRAAILIATGSRLDAIAGFVGNKYACSAPRMLLCEGGWN